MDKYLIFLDASADIDLAYAKENDIDFVYMNYTYDDISGKIKGNETDEELRNFYALVKGGKLPSTSQIAPYLYEELFTPYLKDGVSILYICLSSGLSSTYQSAVLASKNLKASFPESDLVVVDSLSAAGGIGILCERAINNKNNGLSIFDNAKDLEDLRTKIFINVTVEDLMHLKRGGRVSAATAFVGTLLGIKPIIKVTKDGTLELFEKKKGLRQAVNFMVDNYVKECNLDSNLTVYVLHSDNDAILEYAVNKVKEVNPKAKIKTKVITPIIGTHIGPGAIAILAESK
ncbi:MAG: DegV family protein [Clostridia bacterium]|nr:DegV family protein [Clostridia bacterium]